MSVAVIGAGALGELTANIAAQSGREIYGFYDDAVEDNSTVAGSPVRGDVGDALGSPSDEHELLIAIGDVETRTQLYHKFSEEGATFATLIHPTAIIAPTASIGDGVILKDCAVIEPNVTIGDNAIVGNSTTVCHDTEIKKHCRLAPGVTVAGHVEIREQSYLGVNVSVDRTVTIGEQSIIASGCTIWKDVPEQSIVKLPKEMYIDDR